MNYQINLNLAHGGVPPRVNLSQYDDTVPVIVASLYDQGQLFTIPSGSTVYVAGTKQDRTGFEYQCTYSGSTVTIPVTNQMTAFAGDVICELFISKNRTRKGTQNFVLAVEPAALGDDTIISETDLPVMAQLEELVPVLTQALADAENFAEDSEAYAKGTRDGSAVGSGDPAYHNNSSYWNDQAHTAANSSASSATLSRSWAEGGTSTRGGENTNNAKYYSERSYFHAGTAEAEALISEGYARGSQNGLDVASGEYYQNNSKYYANQAASSASDASRNASAAAGAVSEIATMIGAVEFSVDFTTGNLIYTNDATYTFSINGSTGNLEWEVA